MQNIDQHGVNVLMKLKLLNEYHGCRIGNAEGGGFFSLQNCFILHQAFYFVKLPIKE